MVLRNAILMRWMILRK
jgi:hypothetical protein